jgi:hypothetical protein
MVKKKEHFQQTTQAKVGHVDVHKEESKNSPIVTVVVSST